MKRSFHFVRAVAINALLIIHAQGDVYDALDEPFSGSAASLASTSVIEKVVYDSISGSLSTGGTGCCTTPVGQTVTLAGSQRLVTEFEVWLGAGGPSTFFVEFYELDGADNTPGTLVWQSPIQSYPYIGGYSRKVVAVDVPSINVPDTFAWTVTTVTRANNILGSAGSPTVGTRHESWFYFPTDSGWRASDWKFGARIYAVPEPSAAASLLIGFFLASKLLMRVPLNKTGVRG